MCFGVRDAIDLAREHSKGQPLTILGDLVHNEKVMEDFRRSGVTVERDTSRVRSTKVMITAHGASRKRIEEVRSLGLEVVEATCPLVRYAHRTVEKLVSRGFYPVIIGKKGHVEVLGLTEDLAECTVIENPGEIEQIPPHPKLGVAAQTTQPISRVRGMVEMIRQRFPSSEVYFMDTVCRPTKERQKAIEDLAVECDVVLAVGGRDSNNTRQLAEKSRALGARAYHIQGPEDIDAAWFSGEETVGITAGTSTPDELIDAVEARMEQIASGFAKRVMSEVAAV